MAQIVSFQNLEMDGDAQSARRGSITAGATKWMEAELIRLAPGATLEETVPDGSDCYIFTVRGGVTIATGGSTQPMPLQASSVIQQNTSYKLTNTFDGESEMLKVLAPPPGAGSGLPGVKDGLAVRSRDSLAFVEVPQDKKRRQYIVGHGTSDTERGHAMIVHYEKETLTPLHYHPNADSMFVLLDGNINFTIDGKEVLVTPGQAAVFKAGDKHGLRCAPGIEHAAFLEFHVPGAFTTVKE